MMMKYIGNGSWLPGVPARDLSDEEVERFDKDWLLASGLYEEPEVVEISDEESLEE